MTSLTILKCLEISHFKENCLFLLPELVTGNYEDVKLWYVIINNKDQKNKYSLCSVINQSAWEDGNC